MPACDTDPDDHTTLTDQRAEFDITQLAQRVVLCESVLAANPRVAEVDPLMAGAINTTLAIWEEMNPRMARVDRVALARDIGSRTAPVTAHVSPL